MNTQDDITALLEWAIKSAAWLTMLHLVALMMCVLAPASANAQEPSRNLYVGTEMTAPFSMGTVDHWEGLSAELWERISERAGYDYSVKDSGSLSSLINEVSTGSVDVAVASMTITSEREHEFDFTHSFFSTGLSIATSTSGVSFHEKIWYAITTFPILTLFKGLSLLVFVLFIVGVGFVLIERWNHPDLKEHNLVWQFFHGWYWAAVTNTTTGYGVYTPHTILGKIYAVCWMYTSMLITATLIGTIAAIGVMVNLNPGINSLEDLADYNVVTVEGSTSSQFLTDQGIAHSTCPSLDVCLDLVVQGEADATIYDRPVLQYHANTDYTEISVLDEIYDEQSYGFAVPAGSPYLEDINRALLAEIKQPWWAEAQEAVLGE